MAGSGFSISIDLSSLLNTGQVITSAVLPRVRAAVGGIAQQAMNNWASAVMKAPGVWSEEKKAYAGSIKWEYTGEFSARVTTDYRYAQEIEHGRPARDLKKALDTSLKVRTVQKGRNAGKRYLVIPIQHNTPGSGALAPSMPDDVYAAASQLMPSRVSGMGQRVSGTGAWDVKTRSPAMVAQRKYRWGERLSFADTIGPGGFNGSTHQALRGKYEGMYRFDVKGLGGKNRSAYLSFRVMGEWSSGWVVPAKPGLNIVAGVVQRLNPVAEQVLRDAVRLDLGG